MPAICLRLQYLVILIIFFSLVIADTGDASLESRDVDEDARTDVISPDSTNAESESGLATVDARDGDVPVLSDEDSNMFQQQTIDEPDLEVTTSDHMESPLPEGYHDANGDDEGDLQIDVADDTAGTVSSVGASTHPSDGGDVSAEAPTGNAQEASEGTASLAGSGIDGAVVMGDSGESANRGRVPDGFLAGWRSSDSGNSRKGGAWVRALASYDELLKENYLVLSFVQATALGVVGDTIAQVLERQWHPGQKFDFRRTRHAGTLNMILDGVLTPRWYNLLDAVNEDRTIPVAFGKAMAASLIYSPFANGLFLAGARVLHQGLKTRFDWAHWRRQLLVCTVRDFEMWPPLHLMSFWLLPKHWRPLATHAAGVALLAVITATGLDAVGVESVPFALPMIVRWARRKRNPKSPALNPVG